MSDHSYTPGEVPPDPLVGATVADRYLVEKKLGEGGMGAVYLARHVVLEKQVALKILHGEFSGRKDLAERFLHEAKAAARIRHEHVIDITDFGQTHTGNPFFCMEVLAGHDLAHEVREIGPPEWPRIKSIFLQTCSALQAAHEKNIIHRDLKPENIFLIQRSGQPDFVKVLDFGIAKLTDLEETGKRLTKTGMVFGTPEYMSPEQARGDKTDHRVDVYAMGCILYQLVCGDVPFRAESFMGVLTRHLFEPVPPMATQMAKPRDDLPPGLEAVVMRALEKDRDKRYKDMNDLAYAVEALDVVPGVAYYPPGATRPTTATGAVAAMQTPVPKTPSGGVPSTADAATRVPAQGTPAPASPWAEGPVQKGVTAAVTAEPAPYTQPASGKPGKGPPWLWIAVGLAVAGGSAGAVLAMTGKPAAAVVVPDAAPALAETTPDAAPVVAAPPPDAAVAVATPPPVEPEGKKPRDGKKPKPGEKTPVTTPGGEKPPEPGPAVEKPPEPGPTVEKPPPPEEKKPPEGEKKPEEIKNPFGTN